MRRLLLIGGGTYFGWWFTVEGLLPGSYNPLFSRLVVVTYFLVAFAASFAPRISTKHTDHALTAGIWLLTAHYYYLVHRNPAAMAWAVGAYVVAIAAGACLHSRGAQLAYALFTSALASLVAALDPALLHSIFLPGLATMLVLSSVTWHTRSLLESERAERQIVDAQRAAAEATVAAREEFIAIASHELYTPLTALQLTIQSLSSGLSRPEATVQPEKVVARLERCQRDVERLVRLVDELLNTSRMAVAAPSLRLESVRVLDLARDVAALLRPETSRDGPPIELSGDAETEVICDRLRLEQVVMNLLRNARKFGEGKPVRVAVERTSSGVRITVTDQGIGIAHGDQARIFERFERAVSPTHYGGLGLGLYIVRQIVEAHGGSIGVRSELGQGATFVVELKTTPGPISG